MSEEREVADALEHAIAAVESEPPGHVLVEHARLRRGDKLKSTAAVLTALAALVAATGAFFKTLDHGVTESAYNTLSASIVKLSDQEQKTQEDVANIRGYLDGLAHAAPGTVVVPSSVDAGAPKILSWTPPPSHGPWTLGTGANAPPPMLHTPAAPVKPPSFETAISK